MPKIRIRGLVKAMNDARQQLAAGIAPANAGDFRRHVHGVVAEVEQLCRQHRTSPEGLPGPSRRAYRFLKSLDLTALPAPLQGHPAPGTAFRVRGLGTVCKRVHVEIDTLARRLAADPLGTAAERRAGLVQTIQAQIARVDGKAQRENVSPAALPIRSRRAYQWLSFLDDPANLDAHIKIIARAHRLREQLPPRRSHWKQANGKLQIELFHTSYLYRSYPANGQRGTGRLAFNEGFLGAPDAVLEALLLAGSGIHTGDGLRVVRRYGGSEDFDDVVQTIELTAGEASPASQGRAYNLVELFDRVNAEYFGGRMERPNLTWNSTLSRRKLGHYQPSSDTVMISITLDDPQVPQRVIEFVMYHELLHKALGVQIVNGRRFAHTREFRDLEKKFRQFEGVQQSLTRLAG